MGGGLYPHKPNCSLRTSQCDIGYRWLFYHCLGKLYNTRVLLGNANADDVGFFERLFSSLPDLSSYSIILDGNLNCWLDPLHDRSPPNPGTGVNLLHLLSPFYPIMAFVTCGTASLQAQESIYSYLLQDWLIYYWQWFAHICPLLRISEYSDIRPCLCSTSNELAWSS